MAARDYRDNVPKIENVPWLKHSKELDQLNKAAEYMLMAATENTDMSVDEFRKLYLELVDRFGEQAANSAVRALEVSRYTAEVQSTLPSVEAAPAVAPEHLRRTFSWALRETGGYDMRKLAQFLTNSGVMERFINQRARDTVFSNVRKAGTRFVRLPGPYACPFCLMLASRGAVYLSKEKALGNPGNRYHTGCRCVAMECYTQSDVPAFIHELREEWDTAIAYPREGDALDPGEQEAAYERWKEYLYSSRGMKPGSKSSVETIRPVPPVFLSRGQTHLRRKGVRVATASRFEPVSVAELRSRGALTDGAEWTEEQRKIASTLQERNVAKVRGVKPGANRPDYVIGDISVSSRTISKTKGQSDADVAAAALKAWDDSKKSSTHCVVDARTADTSRDVMVSELEQGMHKNNDAREFLFMGYDSSLDEDERYYELVWP